MFRGNFIARLRGSLAMAMLLMVGVLLHAPAAQALVKYTDIGQHISFANAGEAGHLFDSGWFVVQHRGEQTDIAFTLTNHSDEELEAPNRLVLKNFHTLSRVQLNGISGYTDNGDPYVDLTSALAAGASSDVRLSIQWPDQPHGWLNKLWRKLFGTWVFFKLQVEHKVETVFDSKADFPQNVWEVLDTTVDLFHPSFNHAARQRLVDVANAIHLLAVLDDIHDPDLDRLLYYLRAYGSNGPTDLSLEQAEVLDRALRAVFKMQDFRSSAAGSLIEGYVYALRNFYNRSNAISLLDRHLGNMAKLLEFFANSGDIYALDNFNFALFETVRTFALLSNSAVSNPALQDVMLRHENLLPAVVAAGGNAALMIPPDLDPVLGERYNTWVLDWLLYGMSQYWSAANIAGNGELEIQLDDGVRSIVDAYQSRHIFHEVLKLVMYRTYLGNTRFSTQPQLCNNEFAAQCLPDRSADGAVFTANVLEVLNPGVNFFSGSFNHAAPNRLTDIVAALQYLIARDEIADPALERLLNYVSAYGQYAAPLTTAQADTVHQALLNTYAMSQFRSTREPAGRVITAAVFGLRYLYNQAELVDDFGAMQQELIGLAQYFTQVPSFRTRPGYNTASYETVRSFAFLAYDAYWDPVLRGFLKNADFLNAMQAMASDEDVIFPSDTGTLTLDWFLWGMSNLWWDGYADGDTAFQAEIDDRVRAIIDAHQNYPGIQLVKSVVLHTYLEGTSRGLAECNTEFADQCGELDIGTIFTDTLDCPDVNVRILAQDMSDQQLLDSCASMAVSAGIFHQEMRTSQAVPVADDFNDHLEVVIFADSSQYAALGTALFGISTNNGGIYIEGNPANPDNVARFYAHEAEWLRPDFVVWNLEHEFIHYLDGRYVQYGAFHNFPEENVVWWQEGLAEYFAWWGRENTRAGRLLTTLPESNWLSLDTIFQTTYDDSSDQVYGWSFFAQSFMHENHKAEVLLLASYLQGGTSADLAAYQALVDQWALNYQGEFMQYLRDRRDGLLGPIAGFGLQSLSARGLSVTQPDTDNLYTRMPEHVHGHGQSQAANQPSERPR